MHLLTALGNVQVVLLRKGVVQQVVLDLLRVILRTYLGDVGVQVAVRHISQSVLVQHHEEVRVRVVVIAQVIVRVTVADERHIPEVLVLECIYLPVDDLLVRGVSGRVVVVYLWRVFQHGVERHLHAALGITCVFTVFGGDHDHTVGCLGTPDRCCCGIFQYGDALHVVRVQGADRGLHGESVYDQQWVFVGCHQGAESTYLE